MESGQLVHTHAVNKLSNRLVQNNGQLFVHENPLNLGISVKFSSGLQVLKKYCKHVTWSLMAPAKTPAVKVTPSAAKVRHTIGCLFRAISESMLMQSSTRLALENL